MKNRLLVSLVFIFSLFLIGFTPIEEKRVVKDFSLLNVDGKNVSLNQYSDAKGFIIVFTCNHCPFAKLYPERLNQLAQKYKPLGVPLIAISSTDTIMYEDDSYIDMIQKSKDEHFVFPYLYDNHQSVAKNFNAQKTPHAFVIWKQGAEWVVEYNGAIDDNGAEPEKVTRKYIEEAVNSLLAGHEVITKKTSSIGCQILLRK
jgi:peroxiredoxin